MSSTTIVCPPSAQASNQWDTATGLPYFLIGETPPITYSGGTLPEYGDAIGWVLINRSCVPIMLCGEYDSSGNPGETQKVPLLSQSLSPNQHYIWSTNIIVFDDAGNDVNTSSVIYNGQGVVIEDVSTSPTIKLTTRFVSLRNLNVVPVYTITVNENTNEFKISTILCAPGDDITLPSLTTCG